MSKLNVDFLYWKLLILCHRLLFHFCLTAFLSVRLYICLLILSICLIFFITSALWPPCSCLTTGKRFFTRKTVGRPTPAKIYGAREPVHQFPRNFKVKAANYRNTASTTKPYFYPWYRYQMVAKKAMRTWGQICPIFPKYHGLYAGLL